MKKETSVYLPGLHGLRFIAAILVIITHVELFKSRWGLSNIYSSRLVKDFGTIGVDFFFVLSGFLISYLLFIEREKTSNISIKKFYLRRILRIWPLYYIIVLLVFFILPIVSYPEIPGLDITKNYSERLILFSFFLPNVSKAFFDFVPYGGVMWSVGVEEQFYLLWPLIIGYSTKYLRNIVTFFILFILIKVCILLPFFNNFEFIFSLKKLFAMLRLEIMAIGAIGAWLIYFNKTTVEKYLFSIALQIISYLGVFIVIYFLPKELNDTKHIILGFIFLIIILNVSSNSKSLIKLENKVLRFLGNISYGMYMYHMIIAGGIISLFHNSSLDIFTFNIIVYGLVILITIFISYLSYRFIEKPFLKLKNKFTIIKSGSKNN